MNVTLEEMRFAHSVRYRDAMLAAWARTTGHTDRHGWTSYRPAEVPARLDVPTNADRSRAQVIEFRMNPLPHGERYFAYLSGEAPNPKPMGTCNPTGFCITTWTGETLAHVTRITHGVYRFGRYDRNAGSFWARGIDGRWYHGRHNGSGRHCVMRLAKNQRGAP